MSQPIRDENVPGDYAVFDDHWIFWNGDGWRWVARNGASSSKQAFRDAADCTLDYRQQAQQRDPDSVHFSVEHPDGSLTDFGLKRP